MIEPHDNAAEDEHEVEDDEDVRALLKRVFPAGGEGERAPDLLPGVQRRIRRRSRGRFFADGWSTTHQRATYALVGLLTVLLSVLAYLGLAPMGLR